MHGRMGGGEPVFFLTFHREGPECGGSYLHQLSAAAVIVQNTTNILYSLLLHNDTHIAHWGKGGREGEGRGREEREGKKGRRVEGKEGEQEGGRKGEGEGGREGGNKVGRARSIQSLHHVNISGLVNMHLKPQLDNPQSTPLVPYASLPEWLTSCAEVPEDGTAVRGNLQVGGEGAQGRQHTLNPPFSSQHFCS